MLNVCVISVFHPILRDVDAEYVVLKDRQMWLCENNQFGMKWELN